MSFVLYVLLSTESPLLSTETLKSLLDKGFVAAHQGYSSRIIDVPLKGRAVRCVFGSYSMTLTYREGKQVLDDSREIKKRLGDTAPEHLGRCDRCIHVSFADDPGRLYTTLQVDMMSLLEGIQGALIYDLRRNKILR